MAETGYPRKQRDTTVPPSRSARPPTPPPGAASDARIAIPDRGEAVFSFPITGKNPARSDLRLEPPPPMFVCGWCAYRISTHAVMPVIPIDRAASSALLPSRCDVRGGEKRGNESTRCWLYATPYSDRSCSCRNVVVIGSYCHRHYCNSP